jgi:hypothetical protein
MVTAASHTSAVYLPAAAGTSGPGGAKPKEEPDMKAFTLTVLLLTALIAACSSGSPLGPAEDGRGLEPTGDCSNLRLC